MYNKKKVLTAKDKIYLFIPTFITMSINLNEVLSTSIEILIVSLDRRKSFVKNSIEMFKKASLNNRENSNWDKSNIIYSNSMFNGPDSQSKFKRLKAY